MAPAERSQALGRLQRILSTVGSPPVLEAGACAGPRSPPAAAKGKVVWLKAGRRGGRLFPRPEPDAAPHRGFLEIFWVEDVQDIPADTMVIVTTGTPIGGDVLAMAPKLKLVAVAFTGYDHVDLDACAERGVMVANVPGYSTDATAELVMGLVLSSLHRLPECDEIVRNGSWQGPPQETVQSKVVGIVGTGKIGMRLAELCRAFQVKRLLGFSLVQDPDFVSLRGEYVDSLAQLFLDSDIVCLCLPLTRKTDGLISQNLMKLLRPDSLLVNVGRGKVVDELALAELLRQQRFRAALDVYGIEPLPAEHPLRSVPQDQLLMTPHVGYQSRQSLARRFELTMRNIRAFLAGEAMNAVHPG